MKNTSIVLSFIMFALAMACGAPPEEFEEFGETEQAIFADRAVIGWDQNDGWRGRGCQSFSSQHCMLPNHHGLSTPAIRQVTYKLDFPLVFGHPQAGPAADAAATDLNRATRYVPGPRWSWGYSGSSPDLLVKTASSGFGGPISNTISRYLHVACVNGDPLWEQSSLPGTYVRCTSHVAEVDTTALYQLCTTTAQKERCWERIMAHALVRTAGVGSESLSGSFQNYAASRYISPNATPINDFVDWQKCALEFLDPYDGDVDRIASSTSSNCL